MTLSSVINKSILCWFFVVESYQHPFPPSTAVFVMAAKSLLSREADKTTQCFEECPSDEIKFLHFVFFTKLGKHRAGRRGDICFSFPRKKCGTTKEGGP